jgi:hypothetical protein
MDKRAEEAVNDEDLSQVEQETQEQESQDQDEFEDDLDVAEDVPILDRDTIKKLGALMCSVDEIAGYLGVDPDVIRDHYADSWIEGTQAGRVNIRQWQMSQAQGGNIDMLKWLGQQYLKQAPHNK